MSGLSPVARMISWYLLVLLSSHNTDERPLVYAPMTTPESDKMTSLCGVVHFFDIQSIAMFAAILSRMLM